jgi:hypothetical protein
MENKKTKVELQKMSRNDMAHYIEEITQTEVCNDKKYCDLLLTIWLKK